MKSLLAATFLSITVSCFPPSLLADDWPRWRGPSLDGISKESNWRAEWPDSDPPLVWKTNVGTGLSGISIANKKVYTIGNTDNVDTVYCFDADSGKEIWSHSYPAALDPKYYEGGPGSTPTVEGDTVFTISREGHVFSLDAANGSVRWSTHLVADLGFPAPTWGFNGSPLVLGERVFLNAGTSGVALDKASGTVIWKSAADEAGYSSPYPIERDGTSQLVFSSTRSFSGVNPDSGKAAWSFPWLTRYGVNAADPVAVDADTLFISSGYGKGAALIRLSGAEPEVIWKVKEMGNQMNPSLLINGFLYGVNGNEDGDPEFQCLDSSSGEIKWSDDSTGMSGAIAANGYLIILGERGELILAPASPESFDPVTRIQILGGKSWTAPSLANGRVYCRNIRGDLVCVDLR
ncbi:MAG: PQQ-binding-like beta-propeller repeat protein [Verrucomicrobiota bacterium]